MSSRKLLFPLGLAITSLLLLDARADDSMPAPPTEPNGPVLTIDDVINRAMKKNFDIEIQRYNAMNAKETVTIARAAFDPSIGFTAQRNYVDGTASPIVVGKDANGNSVVVSDFHTASDTTRYTPSITKFFSTGATISLSSNLNRNSTNTAFFNSSGSVLFSPLNPTYNSTIAIGGNQPLLRGFGPGVVLANTKIAKLGLAIANYNYRAKILDVIRNTENAYYNLVYAREQLRVRQFTLSVAQKFLDETKAKRATGVATDLDVLTADVGVANAQSTLNTSQQTVKDSQDALLGLIDRFNVDETIGIPKFNDFTGPIPTFAASYALARANDPDFLSSATAIEQAKLNVKVAKNATLPTLNVGGSYGYTGKNSATNTSYGDSYHDTLNKDGYAWELDLTVNIPIGFRGDRARYRQTLNTLSQNNTQFAQVDQTILLQVRSAVRSIETNAQNVKITGLNVQLNYKKYQLEKAKFDAGLSTSRLVLQAQDDMDTASIAELQSKVNLWAALATLERLEGSAVSRYNLAIAEVKY